ncbi:hemicentin-2-like isoform X2 [Amphibalanus amphitrite]|uniref:hemicentin-2-like isoform X2 n=1 Tax=Amphibalanus amphitrite TaxID=1232801 RepID=UPI001C910A13|nr:hemicentin-2-like isoform X2 [Amphibalanus amphitrite]
MARERSSPPLLATLLLLLMSSVSADLDVASRLINVSAVEGQTAELPCDVTPPMAGDELRLVLWYHGTGGTPIYTYDARGRRTLRGEHWVDSSLDRSRVQFQPDARPAHLRVTGVQRADQRLYRCRVDFLHSPTRNSRVNLTVIVPPEPPVLYDSSGRQIRERAGPFREGQTVTITCVTSGGSPSPNVTWWSGNALLDGSWQGSADGAVRNQLTLGPLSRADLGAEYTCWATNHVLSPPRSTTFSIDLLLRPLTVNMMGVNRPLSVGTTYQLSCESAGSRPAASITWWLGSQKLKHAREEHLEAFNVTRSVLSFTPDMDSLGQQLRCQAENHKLRAAPLQQSWPLTVHYKPRPTLRLWSRLQERGTRQGDDVFMKCDVRADPPVTDIRWKFQSKPIGLFPHLSVDISNGSLVLRSVTTKASGQYSCEATNAEGTAESNYTTLDVQVLPVCASDGTETVQAARGETVNVTCSVSANPEPFRYTWALNVSGAVSDVPEGRVTSAGPTSTVSFTPRSHHDFGTLLCWADNLLGRQKEPCRIQLVLAERPGPLHNCSVLNRTTASLETACQAGFHGGLQQWFTVMVRDSVTQEMVANRSSALPRFFISDLQEGRNYTVTMYAYNDRGRGRLQRLQVATLTTPAETGEMTGPLGSLFRMTPILGILIGIVGTLVLLAIAIVVTMRLRGHNDAKEGYPAPAPPEKAAPGSATCHIPANNPDLLTVKIDDIDDPEERYMAERLINRPPLDLPRKFCSRSPPPNSTYCTLGRGEYTRVPSPKMPAYAGPYFSLPRESGQRSCSSDASECRYDTAHSHSGHSDTSTLEEAAPLMADRRESVV